VKMSELDTETLYRTGRADRHVDDRAAMVVDVEGHWTLTERRRFPDEINELHPPYGAAQRRVPVVFTYTYGQDGDVLHADLSPVAEWARSLLVDGADPAEINRKIDEKFGAGDGRGRQWFALTRPQAIESTWADYVEAKRAQAERADEAAAERRAEHDAEQAAHDRIGGLVQAAFGVDPGKPYARSGALADRGLDFGPAYTISSPYIFPDGNREARPIRLSWRQLEAIVNTARQAGVDSGTNVD
jgi:hypothetical protein